MNPSGTSGTGGQPSAASSLPPPQFFVDHKKGEVNELKQLLRAVSLDKDINKRRDVIKKVIAYMTLGIDVSRLYPEMVKASRTDDVVMKKMIYLYLINYAEQNQELAILAVNTFLMDCKQQNHKIRGLALRSLCSLRFEGVSQYLQQAIQEGLNDVDPYVKKTAIIGCIKFYHMSKKDFKKTDFLETLYKLTKDHDALVVINAIEAINEIRANKGGIEITRPLVIHLLNRIKDFNEWGQSIILDLTSKYNPSTQEEMFDIMNLLEDRFKHASSSVVLGAVKVFLHLTKDDDNLCRQVFERLQAPLITLMTSSETTESYEVSYNVLSHIHLLVVKGANQVFESEYKHFFIKYDEPSYIKNLKLEILAYVASANNIQEIVNELSEYVTDVNAEIAKKSIRCFGTIIIRLTKMSKTVAAQLRNFLSLRISYVTTETVIVLKDILRKYRNFIDDFIPFFSKISLDQITEVEGKCAYAWILGEFGEHIDESPYILEKMMEEQKEFNSVKLSSVLLTATFKLFFKRAPEVQKMFGQFLEQLIKNANETDLKQRAVFYYRLLKTDVNLAEKIVMGDQSKVAEFYEDKNEELKERLFLEFNSLSVVYQKPSERFLKDQILKQAQAIEKKYYSKSRWPRGSKVTAQVEQEEEEEEPKQQKPQTISDQQQTVASLDDLLDFGGGISNVNTTQQTSQQIDLLGDFGTPSQSTIIGGQPQQTQQTQNLISDDLLGTGTAFNQPAEMFGAPKQPRVNYALELGEFGNNMFGLSGQGQVNNQTVQLSPTPDLDSERFQQLWMQLPDTQNVSKPLRNDIIFNTTDIEQALASQNIFCMASGQIGSELKFFFYAQMLDKSGYFLLEALVNQQTFLLTSNLKTTRTDLGQAFVNNLLKGFAPLLQTQKEKEEKLLKERLEKERERQLQDQLEQQEKGKDLQKGKRAIKNSGILDAYDNLLEDLITNGLPKLKLNGDLFEYASFFIERYHNKIKKSEWEERNIRMKQREKEKQRMKEAIEHAKKNKHLDDDSDSDDDRLHRRDRRGRTRSKSAKQKGLSKGPKSKIRGGKYHSSEERQRKKSRARSKSVKGHKEGKGPKSRRSDSPSSNKGKNTKNPNKKGDHQQKSRRSESAHSNRQQKGAKTQGQKGGIVADKKPKKGRVNSDDERGSSGPKTQTKDKNQLQRAKSQKKVTINEDYSSDNSSRDGKKGNKFDKSKGIKQEKDKNTKNDKDNVKGSILTKGGQNDDKDKGLQRNQSQGKGLLDKNGKDAKNPLDKEKQSLLDKNGKEKLHLQEKGGKDPKQLNNKDDKLKQERGINKDSKSFLELSSLDGRSNYQDKSSQDIRKNLDKNNINKLQADKLKRQLSSDSSDDDSRYNQFKNPAGKDKLTLKDKNKQDSRLQVDSHLEKDKKGYLDKNAKDTKLIKHEETKQYDSLKQKGDQPHQQSLSPDKKNKIPQQQHLDDDKFNHKEKVPTGKQQTLDPKKAIHHEQEQQKPHSQNATTKHEEKKNNPPPQQKKKI